MSLLESFITHYEVEITRVAQGIYDDDSGLWSNGLSSFLNVDMSIQPVNQKERLILPEAVRNKEIIKIYHGIALQITDDRQGVKGDTFVYNSNTYRIFSTSNWSSGGYDIKYYKSFAIMVDKGGSYVK